MAEKRRASQAWIEDPGLPRLLRLLRQEAGWSQKEVAEAAGLTPSAVTRLEKGERRPSIDVFERLSRAFGLAPSYLAELARRLADKKDADAEEEVLRIVRSFTTSSSLKSRYQSGELPQETAPAFEASGVAPPERREIAATVPHGELRWVFRQSVGRDDRGFWIDPAARANRGGIDAEDVRIVRLDDGTFEIDVGGLEHDVGPRDHERHVTLARVAGRDAEPVLHDAYVATVLEISLPNGDGLVVEPTTDGSVHGEFPQDMAHVHVITASNPRSRLATPDENKSRNNELRDVLRTLGAEFNEAVGRSPDGAWSEESFAVFDGDEQALLELAGRYEQNAIFRWEPSRRVVRYVVSGQSAEHGWQSRPESLAPGRAEDPTSKE